MRRFGMAVAAVVTMSMAAAGTARADDKALFGTLLGGIGGAVAGAQFGKGKGQLVGVAAGTLLGAGLGNSVGRSLDRADTTYYGQRSGGYYQPGYAPAYYDYPPPRHYHRPPPREVVYYPPPPVYAAPAPRYYGAPVTYEAPVQQPSNAGYCREYQSTVTVGGRAVPAYGQACMQPDGSWKLGALTPEQ